MNDECVPLSRGGSELPASSVTEDVVRAVLATPPDALLKSLLDDEADGPLNWLIAKPWPVLRPAA